MHVSSIIAQYQESNQKTHSWKTLNVLLTEVVKLFVFFHLEWDTVRLMHSHFHAGYGFIFICLFVLSVSFCFVWLGRLQLFEEVMSS